jgi:hypothetical protein
MADVLQVASPTRRAPLTGVPARSIVGSARVPHIVGAISFSTPASITVARRLERRGQVSADGVCRSFAKVQEVRL